MANYKARGVSGDELIARVEEEFVTENERFHEVEHRLKEEEMKLKF